MDAREEHAASLIAQAIDSFSWNGAGHLTCSEADDIALGLARLGHRDEAVTLLVGHGTDGDDDGDDRHADWYEEDTETVMPLAEEYLRDMEATS